MMRVSEDLLQTQLISLTGQGWPGCRDLDGAAHAGRFLADSLAYARGHGSEAGESALDSLCRWIEVEEDARVERDTMLRRIGVRPASQGMYREDRATVKPTPRWRAWLARIFA